MNIGLVITYSVPPLNAKPSTTDLPTTCKKNKKHTNQIQLHLQYSSSIKSHYIQTQHVRLPNIHTQTLT